MYETGTKSRNVDSEISAQRRGALQWHLSRNSRQVFRESYDRAVLQMRGTVAERYGELAETWQTPSDGRAAVLDVPADLFHLFTVLSLRSTWERGYRVVHLKQMTASNSHSCRTIRYVQS